MAESGGTSEKESGEGKDAEEVWEETRSEGCGGYGQCVEERGLRVLERGGEYDMKKWSDEGLQKGERALEGKSHKDLNKMVKFTSRRISNTSKKFPETTWWVIEHTIFAVFQ